MDFEEFLKPLLAFGSGVLVTWCLSYFKESGKLKAQSQQLDKITKIVEEVKSDISEEYKIREYRYKLKYEACIDALKVVDQELSYSSFSKVGSDDVIPATKQRKIDVAFARECHNKLILSCESAQLVDKFMEILCRPSNVEGTNPHWAELLSDFRKLIRKELEFGNSIELNRDNVWLGSLGSDKWIVTAS